MLNNLPMISLAFVSAQIFSSSFTDDPACILRVALSVSARDIVLNDDVRIARGAPVLELHFWNERLPVLPRRGASLEWGIEAARRALFALPACRMSRMQAAVQSRPRAAWRIGIPGTRSISRDARTRQAFRIRLCGR